VGDHLLLLFTVIICAIVWLVFNLLLSARKIAIRVSLSKNAPYEVLKWKISKFGVLLIVSQSVVSFQIKMSNLQSQDIEQCKKLCQECLLACEHCYGECLDMMTIDQTCGMIGCVKTCNDCKSLCLLCVQFIEAHSYHLLPQLCAVCVTACKMCEVECKKHAHHHEHCNRCSKSCHDCIQICEKLAGGAQ